MQIEDFSIRLRNGAGNGNPRDGLCLMQAVHWFSGADKVSDHPECTSPVLCTLGIRLNDMAPSQEHRDRLWPLVWRLLDSRDPAAEQRRIEHIVREVAHRIVAPLFDNPEFAARLRQARSMEEIKAAADAASWAAREAAADAATWEAATWEAAARAARAAAAAAAREAAAEAAADAASDAAAWEELRLIFIEAIQLGRHGEADPAYALRARELARILEAAK